MFYPAIEVIGALAAALIIWFGGGWTMQGTLTLGSLVAFLQYSQRFFRPISDMSEKFNVLQAAMASSERIFKLLDTPGPHRVAAGADSGSDTGQTRSDRVRPRSTSDPCARRPGRPGLTPPKTPGSIVFDDVSFAYNGTDYVLRNVSFEVEAGRAGGHRRRDRGRQVDADQPAAAVLRRHQRTHPRRRRRRPRPWTCRRCRAKFSLVLQDVHLFSGTVASNIRLGNTAISDDAVRDAAAAVHAAAFIERLPNRYGQAVAERGATLSVGQKQLLSFARALAFDPEILILDEATSSVDTETELTIRDALKVLMAGRTTLAIAHRLSTIQDMDKILVLHQGELRESGTHQELLAGRGIYYKLYQLQFKDQELTSR